MANKNEHSMLRESIIPNIDVFLDTVLQRIDEAERLRSETLHSIGNVAKALDKTRKYKEKTVLQLLRIHEFEGHSSRLGKDLKCAAKSLYELELYRNAEIKRIEEKVIREFFNAEHKREHEKQRKEIYEILKNLKQYIAEESKARKALEISGQGSEEKGIRNSLATSLRLKKRNSSWILAMKRAKWKETHRQVMAVLKSLDEKLKMNETRRSSQFRNFFERFIEIQMIFHAKALEKLSAAYKCVKFPAAQSLFQNTEDWRSYKEDIGLTVLESAIDRYRAEGESLGATSHMGSDVLTTTMNAEHVSQENQFVEKTGSREEIYKTIHNPDASLPDEEIEQFLNSLSLAESSPEVSEAF